MDDVEVTLRTRLKDWLFHRPWTKEQLAERVALSIANTYYSCWNCKLGRCVGHYKNCKPVTGINHHFDLSMTDDERDEAANREEKTQ